MYQYSVSIWLKLFLFLLFPLIYSCVVIPELAANDQLMKFWMSIAKPDVSCRNLYSSVSAVLFIKGYGFVLMTVIDWEESGVIGSKIKLSGTLALLGGGGRWAANHID